MGGFGKHRITPFPRPWQLSSRGIATTRRRSVVVTCAHTGVTPLPRGDRCLLRLSLLFVHVFYGCRVLLVRGPRVVVKTRNEQQNVQCFIHGTLWTVRRETRRKQTFTREPFPVTVTESLTDKKKKKNCKKKLYAKHILTRTIADKTINR
jgi:hypothetical protein